MLSDDQLRCEAIFERQRGLCFYCGKPMANHRFRPRKRRRWGGYTVDHFIPRSLGFGLKDGGKVLAHAACNVKKGNRLPTDEEFRRFQAIFGFAPDLPMAFSPTPETQQE